MESTKIMGISKGYKFTIQYDTQNKIPANDLAY